MAFFSSNQARSRDRSKRRGTASVEFAVLAPVIFLLFFAMIEFSRAFMGLEYTANAARAGARAGSIATKANYSSIGTAVNTSLSNSGISTSGATVTVVVTQTDANGNPTNSTTVASANDFNPGSRDRISVTVSVPYANVSLLPSGQSLGNFFEGSNLSETATMRSQL